MCDPGANEIRYRFFIRCDVSAVIPRLAQFAEALICVLFAALHRIIVDDPVAFGISPAVDLDFPTVLAAPPNVSPFSHGYSPLVSVSSSPPSFTYLSYMLM